MVTSGSKISEAALPVGYPTGPRFRSISEEVAETLRNMILVGDLPPGEQVTQERLANRLGVSAMPVREALLRLSHEGLIEARRGRSFRVTRITREDVADIYWLHATIERELTRKACAHADEMLPDLQACFDTWTAEVKTADPATLEELNFRFHWIINRAAGSQTLLRALRHTLVSIPQQFYARLPEWVDISTAGHGEILDAIRRRNCDDAGDAAARHVLDAGKLLTARFDETGFWTAPAGA